ncbi:YncE family protein [Chryseobacterium sp. HR92]|uniref:YncE family protein n=1 Tax=Chryseobacterium sp. HR92 TaxID=3094839 RepID=UPI00388D9BB8|nr:hypothetical protein SFA27_13590 [Chryseobacterium sp. HR92]
MIVDPKNNQLYVSNDNRVNIIDKVTESPIAEITDTNGVHGIAFIPNTNKGYIFYCKLNKIKVFDTQTNTIIGEIPTGKNPDAIFYETF